MKISITNDRRVRGGMLAAAAVALTAGFVYLQMAPWEQEAGSQPQFREAVPSEASLARAPGEMQVRPADNITPDSGRAAAGSAIEAPLGARGAPERGAPGSGPSESTGGPFTDAPAPSSFDGVPTPVLIEALRDSRDELFERAAEELAARQDPAVVADLWQQFFQLAETDAARADIVLDVLAQQGQEVAQARAYLHMLEPVDWRTFQDAIDAHRTGPAD